MVNSVQIVGPTRSGSTWHQDPNGTSAWNAVTVGSKAWIMFSPDVTPPGVFVSADQGEVEAPLSLAGTFLLLLLSGYFVDLRSNLLTSCRVVCDLLQGCEGNVRHASKGRHQAGQDARRHLQRWRNLLRPERLVAQSVLTCFPSPIRLHSLTSPYPFPVVINLAPSIAVTQNFVSHRELPTVLRFMRDRPEQVSGFKLRKPEAERAEVVGGLDDCDECVTGVYEAFCQALQREKPELGDVEGLLNVPSAEAATGERTGGVWEQVKAQDGGFSFGFGGDADFDEEYCED